MTERKHGRRRFLQLAGIGTAASLAGSNPSAAQDDNPPSENRRQRFELGLASYTLRKFDLDKTLVMTNRLGLKYIALKDYHLPLDSKPEQIKEVVKKVADAGLKLYGGGVINMKNVREVNNAFDYAKAAGMKVGSL